ncbi:cytochrome P450 [Novosphingobium taihuense]|uniref:Cytochrome P450 n=1 Tax=Novosphingobium taihuense TaxID=260085 RepID=A0A7W7AEB2_9SPHN|nr:cytochrome P450 [Novosphingobium taihuense]MBB4615429.1 cytochrome P450 [Novosphingobium taihuense]TWH82123.1 cytochrome P450 [Novosphingobium taihuense]
MSATVELPVVEKPAHVPASLVHDFDLYVGPGEAGRSYPDIHAEWRAWQDRHPAIFWTPRNGGHWVLTRWNGIRKVALDPARFSSRDIFVPQGTAPFLIPTNADAPLHSKYRRLMEPFFSPAALRRVTEEARAAAIAIIEEIKPRGRCEFMADFASRMPVVAFMVLVNLPREDLDYLLGIAGKLSPDDPDQQAAWASLGNYVRTQIELRRTNPQDDFISSLLKAEVMGRKMSDEEIFSLALLTISGGLDTVAISIGFAAAHLARHPAHRRELIEHPERIDNAINEMLRRYGVSNIARVAVDDVELDGVAIKAGESVMLMYPLAGLDDSVTPDPLTVDFQRKAPQHLVFGIGPHTCVGNRLGKREIGLFIEEWLARIPDFSIEPDTEPKARCGIGNSLKELCLVWPV